MKFKLRKSDGSLSSDTPEYDKEGKLTKVLNENYLVTKCFTNGYNETTKMTEITTLLAKYPNLEYEDGFFYPDSEDDGFITNRSGVPLNARELIENFWEGESITLPNNGDPREDKEQVVTGKEYVAYVFQGDYEAAFKCIHNMSKI